MIDAREVVYLLETAALEDRLESLKGYAAVEELMNDDQLLAMLAWSELYSDKEITDYLNNKYERNTK